jgi:tetratricopeptide (TPR) repeat protein
MKLPGLIYVRPSRKSVSLMIPDVCVIPTVSVSMSQINPTCRYCSSVADNKDRFLIWFLWDVRNALDVVLGDVMTPCRVCGQKDGLQPSVLAISIRAHQIFCLTRGDILQPLATVQQGFSELFSVADLAPLSVDQTTELSVFQDHVSSCLAKSASLFPYLGRPDANLDTEICEVWRGLQGEVLTAVLACTLGAVRGARMAPADHEGASVTTEQITASLKGWSRDALIRLPLWLQRLNSQRVSFEEILFRLVDTSTFVAGEASSIIEALGLLRSSLEKAGGDAILNFQIEALQASLCRTGKIENPREIEWAQAFLLKEIASARSRNTFAHLRLTRTRLNQTISRKAAWDAAVQIFGSILLGHEPFSAAERDENTQTLRAATKEMGYPGLVDELYASGLRIGPAAEAVEDTPEDIAQRIASVAWTGAFPPDTSVHDLLEMGTRQLSWGADVASIDRLVDILLKRTGDNLYRRADVLWWFGRRMKELDAPSRALSRIGEEPAEWEFRLDPVSRLYLWTERCNALRLARATELALNMARKIVDLANEVGSQGNRATAMMNLGILQRENGLLDQATSTLATAALLLPDHQRGPTLRSLGNALFASGRYAEAAAQFEAARKITRGDEFWILLASEAGARNNAGEREEAANLFRQFADVDSIPQVALITYAGVFAGIAERGNEQDDRTARRLIERLRLDSDKFIEGKNWLRASQCIGAAARVASAFALEMEVTLWKRHADIDFASNTIPDLVTVIELARIAMVEGKTARASEMLSVLPVSLAQFYGGLNLTAQSLEALSPLEAHFNRLIEVCINEGYSISSIQKIAEIRRNAHARAVQFRRKVAAPEKGDPPMDRGDPEECIPLIGGGLEPFLVLEWIWFGSRALFLCTLIKDGEIKPTAHTSPAYLAELNEDVESRLVGWRNGRRGEPFDVSNWFDFLDTLRGVVAERLPPGGHVVVIEHASCSSIPFHIALAPEWTCSYAPDWSAVVAAARSSLVRGRLRRFGLVYVPRSNESKTAIKAFESSLSRSQEFFGRLDIPVKEAIETDADSDLVKNIMSEVDVMKIMCHGQLSKTNAEVALLVAHDHRLPPGHAFAASTEAGQKHRLGWRQMSDVNKSAPVIFVGACSSGTVQVLGLDERISLFSSLRPAGVQTLVAPRWKIDVELAMPVLDDTLEAYAGGRPLARALAIASEAGIKRGIASWQARSFAIEGGWV